MGRFCARHRCFVCDSNGTKARIISEVNGKGFFKCYVQELNDFAQLLEDFMRLSVYMGHHVCFTGMEYCCQVVKLFGCGYSHLFLQLHERWLVPIV